MKSTMLETNPNSVIQIRHSDKTAVLYCSDTHCPHMGGHPLSEYSARSNPHLIHFRRGSCLLYGHYIKIYATGYAAYSGHTGIFEQRKWNNGAVSVFTVSLEFYLQKRGPLIWRYDL